MLFDAQCKPLRRTPAATLSPSAKRQMLLPLITPSTVARSSVRKRQPLQRTPATALSPSAKRQPLLPLITSSTSCIGAQHKLLRQTPAATLPPSAKRKPLLPLVNAVDRRMRFDAQCMPLRRTPAPFLHTARSARRCFLLSRRPYRASARSTNCSGNLPRPLLHAARSARRYFLSSTPSTVARTRAACISTLKCCPADSSAASVTIRSFTRTHA